MALVKNIHKKGRSKDKNPFNIGDLVEVFYTLDEDRSVVGYLEEIGENWRGPFVIVLNAKGRAYKVPCYRITKCNEP